MKAAFNKWIFAAGILAIGIAIAVAGISLGEADDAPGASLIGILVLVGSAVIAARIARRGIAR